MGFNSKYTGTQVETILDALQGISYDQVTHSFVFEGNIIVTGGAAFRAVLGDLNIPTIMDYIIVDEQTIIKDTSSGQPILKLNPNLDLGGLDTEELQKYLEDNKYVTVDKINEFKFIDEDTLKKYFNSNAVTLDTYQEITEEKNFKKGIKLNDSPIISYDKNTNSYLFDGNIIVSGSAIFRTSLDNLDIPDVWSSIPFDDTMSWDGSKWSVVKSGGGGGGSAEVTYDSVISALGYTPLSTAGGTVIATGRRQLSLQSSTDAQAALWLGTGLEQFTKGGFLQYDYSNGSIALVNFSAMANSYTGLAGLFIKRDNRITVGDANLSAEYDVLHSGNYANYALPVTGGTVKGSSRFVMMRNGDHSSIIPEVTALTISTNSASYGGYNTGIGFNALGDYGSLTHQNHIHAWIGLGGAVDTALSEIYPLVFAVNGSTTTGTAPIERMRISPKGEFHIRHIGVGSYSEGLRLYNSNGAKDGWSEINFGCDPSATSGTHDYQWTVGRNGSNNFIIRNAWTDRFQIDLSGYASLWGNLIVTGGITAHYTSDERLKKNLRPIDAGKMILSLGRVMEFEYIDSEVERNSLYKGSHIGLVYQDVKGSALPKMCFEREDGYGSLNYLDTSLTSLLVGVAQEHEIRLTKDEREIQDIKSENMKLREEIAQLKLQLYG